MYEDYFENCHSMKCYKLILAVVTTIASFFSAVSAKAGQVEHAFRREYNVLEFGAVADGTTLSTASIQKAIDKASEKGGRVVIPKGTFVSGTLILKEGVDLHLMEGAQLLGSLDIFDYREVGTSFAWIVAKDQNHIKLSGAGLIDGRGRTLALRADSLYHLGQYEDPNYNYYRTRLNRRPKVLEFVGCSDLEVRNVTIKNSASWVQSYILCADVRIDSITVDSDAYWNNDGIDIQDSKNVTITNCFINSADDGICLKSENPDKMNENIYIANCTVRSSASAVKFGTASFGGFKHIRIEHIKVYDTYRSAIALESVDGGVLEDVVIEDIQATNTGNAIFIRLGHRNESGPVGTLRDVTIRNVKVQVPFARPDLNYDLRGPDLPFFHNPFPSSITGIPGHLVQNIVLENIEITFPGRANKGMAYLPLSRLTQVGENEAGYPEFSMFGELPSWAFYVRHVKGIKMKNVVVKLEDDDFRPAFVFDDVKDIELTDVHIEPHHETKNEIILYKSDLPDVNVSSSEGIRYRMDQIESVQSFRGPDSD